MMQIALNAHTQIAGVIGWPVAHSRSPLLHNFWLARHGINGAYLAFPVEPGNVAAAIRGLAVSGLRGLNVTIPHKQEALALCDEVTDFARQVGAVNTLKFDHGRIYGDNTDGFGFIENLRAHGVNPAAGPALVLGAGGAARAIVASLQNEGAQVTIANRTASRAEALAADFPGARVVEWSQAAAGLRDQVLLVNTSSAGMHGQPPLDFPLAQASPSLAVADIVYVPRETTLLAGAAARGLRVVPGLGMLLHQARPGFRAWFGLRPEVDQELIDFVAGDIPIQ
jgi:shikimate dehydrogenase